MVIPELPKLVPRVRFPSAALRGLFVFACIVSNYKIFDLRVLYCYSLI